MRRINTQRPPDGWYLEHTGGGCTAWQRVVGGDDPAHWDRDKCLDWITAHDDGLEHLPGALDSVKDATVLWKLQRYIRDHKDWSGSFHSRGVAMLTDHESQHSPIDGDHVTLGIYLGDTMEHWTLWADITLELALDIVARLSCVESA
jgi:hypothetical protein